MSQSFVTILVSNPSYLLSLFVLLMARIMPIVALVPFFGAKVLPNPAKITLSLCIATILYPFVMSHTKTPVAFNNELLFLVIKEVVIGLIIGFSALVPFTIAQMAGIVVDHQRGSASLMINDPTQSIQVSSLGLLYSYMMIAIFFWIDGPFIFLDGLVKSYHVLPPDTYPTHAFFAAGAPFTKMAFGLMTYLTALSCQMAAPSLLMILMSNVFLGIMNRLAPQVQITFLGLSLNAYLGDLALWAAWFFILDRLGIEALKWLQKMTTVIESFALT